MIDDIYAGVWKEITSSNAALMFSPLNFLRLLKDELVKALREKRPGGWRVEEHEIRGMRFKPRRRYLVYLASLHRGQEGRAYGVKVETLENGKVRMTPFIEAYDPSYRRPDRLKPNTTRFHELL